VQKLEKIMSTEVLRRRFMARTERLSSASAGAGPTSRTLYMNPFAERPVMPYILMQLKPVV
jgi:hypothetical protein